MPDQLDDKLTCEKFLEFMAQLTKDFPDFQLRKAQHFEQSHIVELVNPNPDGENIEINNELWFTMWFHGGHVHYDFFDTLEKAFNNLKADIEVIVSGKQAAISLFSNERWLGDAYWDTSKPFPLGSADAAIREIHGASFPQAFIDEVKRLGGRIEYVCWNPKNSTTYHIRDGKLSADKE